MSYRRTADLNPFGALKGFGKMLSRKIAFSALAWVVLYFASQPLRAPGSILMMFTMVLGSLAGGAIGWWMAEDAAETAGFSGMVLWITLVLASALSIWGVEGLGLLAFGKTWMGFGGFMMASVGTVTALGAAVWRASADD